jgi:hypothetical protein
MSTLLALLLVAAPFPLPAVDGKPLAVTEKQKVFRLPQRFETLKAFYLEQFEGQPQVTVRVSGAGGQRTLSLKSARKGDAWVSATVREEELTCVVEVKPVLQMGTEAVEGQASPLVHFVFGRSAEAAKAAQEIDHTEALRK